jgi:putative membrane protein
MTGSPARTRWPGWVYSEGEEPDYRFTFANERTFLAWIRTALALLAAGVAVDALDLPMSAGAQRVVAAVLVVLGLLCSAFSSWRWARSERAMRRGEPLPGSLLGVAISAALVLVAAIVLIVTV